MKFAAKAGIRSPLRYPGGKSRGIKHLVPMIEKVGAREVIAPFFGGGSIEIACAKRGIRVWGYDGFKPVVVFWQALLKRREALVEAVESLYPLQDKKTFKALQKQLREGIDDPTNEAAAYFVVNRCSFNGTTLSGGFSKQAAEGRFTKSSIDRLRKFECPNLTVRWADFTGSLRVHPKEKFVYADPPYMINSQNLYGTQGDMHKDFDHVALYELLCERPSWMLSYNNCEEVRELYKGYKFYYPDWKYGMSEDKNSKEILIVSQ